MATKLIEVPGMGPVSFQKRRSSRSVRLKISPNGQVVVTLPYFLPYRSALGFLQQHSDWVEEELSKRKAVLEPGMLIGRAHTLVFLPDTSAKTPKVRVGQNTVTIRYSAASYHAADVQAAAQRGAIRAIKREAEHFLPKRLADIADREGYTYDGSAVKQMRSRWGSCNQDKFITLNIFLMTLPIELIDYVILHELAHTRHLNHSAAFWQEFEAHLPGAKQLRKRIRQYHPAIPAEHMA